MPEVIAVVGLDPDTTAQPPPAALEAVRTADLLVGSGRHLQRLGPHRGDGPALVLGTGGVDLASAMDALEKAEGKVCVLASGDPGFFGVVRPLAERFGTKALSVFPAVSAVSVAFARLGIPWDDAVVASAHGRSLADALVAVSHSDKAALMVSPECPPEAVGAALIASGSTVARAFVCSRIGSPDETVTEVDLDSLASGTWDPLSVVILLNGSGVAGAPVLSWGLDDDAFAHRDGMVTKAEVRAVALGKLELPETGVLWDVGAGSASVAIECARLRPRLTVLAVESDPDDAARAKRNVSEHSVAVDVVTGRVPDALAGLPDPDRAFVGGGGISALDAVIRRLRPGGRVVASFAALDRAAAAADRLGSLVQLGVSRGRSLRDGGWRLAAENPVFLAWGPPAAPGAGGGPR